MDQPLSRLDGTTSARRHFRYFDYVMAAFVAILLLSNLIGAAKLATLGGFTFGAGILFFPVSYVIGDVLTEVYGYANARRCIWAGFSALVFMAFMSWVVVAMPPAPGWDGQSAYESVFGQVPRIVIASMLAFWAGEFVNSFVLAKMKIWTQGKHLWSRTIGSTVFGQAVDSAIFYPVAFLGVWETQRSRHRDVHQLGAQGAVGSGAHARHLWRGRLDEGARGCRCLRHRHRILAIRQGASGLIPARPWRSTA